MTTGIALVTSASGPCFELAGRVGLGVDVGDLLELERAFQRDRVVQAAAQEQRVLHAVALSAQLMTCGSSASTACSHRAGGAWLQVPASPGQAAAGSWPASSVSRNRPASWVVKALVGHADLDPGARDVGQLAFAHHGAGGHVADGQRLAHAQALRMAQRASVSAVSPDCVMVTTRLRVRHRVAVAVSLATSTWSGMPAMLSSQYQAVQPL